jgi:catechol 2,3-dioxygenase-like lactoylglutathione lyase family enzyme
MLETSEPVAFIASLDLDRSEAFYGDVLSLAPVSRSPFATVFHAGAATLRITKVDAFQPQPFTVFGWVVADIRAVLHELRDRNLALLHYEGLEQDDEGVWTTPNGDLVAWFKDPDANVLSVTQFANEWPLATAR